MVKQNPEQLEGGLDWNIKLNMYTSNLLCRAAALCCLKLCNIISLSDAFYTNHDVHRHLYLLTVKCLISFSG